jgi:ribosomal protein S18 acetylase RimI-like enzyme
MARLNARRGTSLERCCGNNYVSPVCHCTVKDRKVPRGLHRPLPGLSKMVLVIALLVCACLNPSCAFVPSHKFRPTRVSLNVVETKTRSAVDTTPTIPATHHHTIGHNISDSIFILSSADEEEERTEPPQPKENAPETSAQSFETTAEDAPVEENEEQKSQRLVATAKAAALALLARRRGVSSGGAAVRKTTTSVGERRVGSATQARAGARSKDKLLNAIRKAASANTAEDDSSKENEKPSASIQHVPEHYKQPSSKLSTSAIHATITEMLDQACRRTTGSMGLLGDTFIDGVETQPEPLSGTILVHPIQKTRNAKAAERMTVRVATPLDHLDIANLRLSVFSDFSAEMRKTFCSRSLQILSNRQSRGATCIVATVPRYGSILSPRPDIILGSAECSDHEFLATILGLRRPPESILYITEVAVNPTARRKGIGYKMMEVSAELGYSTCFHSFFIYFRLFLIMCCSKQAIDELASIRGVETIYLHVDVSNVGALLLYKRAGYEKVKSDDPAYFEFTRSLNLHDGATKGRNHFLLEKHLCDEPTWLPMADTTVRLNTGTLGFEIMPAASN